MINEVWYDELEVLDWLWSDTLVEELIDKLGQLIEKYKYTHVDLVLDQREYALEGALIQSVVLIGIPIANA